jgi:serine/threonine protein kinase
VGIGSAWCKTLWITKDPGKDEAPTYDPAQYRYVPATIEDNTHVAGDYAEKLERLPSEALRQAYRHGSWEFLEGQFFSEFRSEKDGEPWHVVREMPKLNGIPINEVPWLEWWRGLDWGIANLTVCGWYCALPNGRVVKVYEKTWKEFLPATDVAREIVTFTRRYIKGKVRYMSPEQAFGQNIDRRTDIYALAIVLWEMLTMQRLFKGSNDLALLDEVRDRLEAVVGKRKIERAFITEFVVQ